MLTLKVTIEEKTRALQIKEQLTDQGIITHSQSPYNQDLHSCMQEHKEKLRKQHTMVTKHSATFNERQRRLSAEEAKAFREADKSIKGTKNFIKMSNKFNLLTVQKKPRS